MAYWREWLANGTFPDHPWRSYIERSALTLKGLSYAPTGAIMAAAGSSLPETPRRARNWDYRYSWIRDSSFMLRSLYRLGVRLGALEYLACVIEAVGGAGSDSTCRWSPHRRSKGPDRADPGPLSGWRNSRPVQVGSGPWDQRPDDVWGMILDAVEIHLRMGAAQIVHPVWGRASPRWSTPPLRTAGDPDQGIWEIRGDPEHFTASKVLCWVAMDRGADHGPHTPGQRAGRGRRARQLTS